MEDIEAITLEQKVHRLPYTELPAVWWATMECRWPEQLGEAPENLTEADLGTIRETALRRIGDKACYRYMNVHHGFMTDQLFEDWWESQQQEMLRQQSKQRAKDRPDCGTDRCNKPIMTALRAFLFGCLGGLLGRLLLELLKLL